MEIKRFSMTQFILFYFHLKNKSRLRLISKKIILKKKDNVLQIIFLDFCLVIKK